MGLFHLLQVYGNNAEIQALCEMYNRPIHIFSYGTGANYVYIILVRLLLLLLDGVLPMNFK